MILKTIVYYIVCIDELLKVKQLIDKKAVADFCSRFLGIYALMRVNDTTKIWRKLHIKDANRTKYKYFGGCSENSNDDFYK